MDQKYENLTKNKKKSHTALRVSYKKDIKTIQGTYYFDVHTEGQTKNCL